MEISKDSVFLQKYPFEQPPVNIREYFGKFSKSLYKQESSNGKTNDVLEKEFMRKMLNISDEHLSELEAIADPENFTCPGEITPFEVSLVGLKPATLQECLLSNLTPRGNSDEIMLESVKCRRNLEAEGSGNFGNDYFKYEGYKWCTEDAHCKTDLNPFLHNTVVVCVKVYHSTSGLKSQHTKFKLLQEIHMLHNQTLAQLKDKISCPLDYIGLTDISNDYFFTNPCSKKIAKDLYPSSFIFIEDTFYNDTRTADMRDLSEVIRTWGSGRGLGPFNVEEMHKVEIQDVTVKIGRPYVYQHQGSCEHILVISDMRFLNLNDPPKSTSYPRVHAVGNINAKLCMMCGKLYARFVVVGNSRLTHDKAYMCEKCFISYNYVKGVKIGEFQAYEYVDPVALL